MKCGVIIVAAGEGRRLGEALPKAFVSLGGKPLCQHSLSFFKSHSQIQDIILVVPPGKENFSQNGSKIVAGGKTRQESVANGLKVLDEKCDWVLVHDAARPFVTLENIDKLLDQAKLGHNAILAHPISDTVKLAEENRIVKTLDRKNLWGAETPQLCQVSALKEALKKAEANNWAVTDEASLLEKLGIEVYIVESDATNIKITTKKDWQLAETILKEKRS